MTKTTSQSRALLKKLAVVPVFAGLVFISCSENVGDKTPAEAKVVEVKPGEKVEPNTLPETDIYTSVETLPEFPGGLEAFGKYVQKEFKIPEDFVGEGNVLVSFIVETDGSLSDIKVIKDLGFGTKEEALRMMSKSPKWSPGIQDDKPVRVAYNLPIRLKIT